MFPSAFRGLRLLRVAYFVYVYVRRDRDEVHVEYVRRLLLNFLLSALDLCDPSYAAAEPTGVCGPGSGPNDHDTDVRVTRSVSPQPYRSHVIRG